MIPWFYFHIPMRTENSSSEAQTPPGVFPTTHWSVVLAANDRGSPQEAAALGGLCGTYWYPIYAYVRRQGHSPEDAQDLTQEFSARILARNYLAGVDRERGRFRSYLLGALNHFLADELGRFLRGELILARPLGRAGKAAKWCRRNPLPAAALSVASLSLLDLVTLKHPAPDNSFVRYYRNNGNSNNWLCVKCIGTVSPRFATGTVSGGEEWTQNRWFEKGPGVSAEGGMKKAGGFLHRPASA